MPFELPHKFIIFTQAHLIPKDISNKLLKSLEDIPEKSTLFFLLPAQKSLLPTISSRASDALEFVDTTLSRLYNPFIEHRLSDIALMHETKLRKRLLPTYYEYIEQNDKKPPILSELLRDII